MFLQNLSASPEMELVDDDELVVAGHYFNLSLEEEDNYTEGESFMDFLLKER